MSDEEQRKTILANLAACDTATLRRLEALLQSAPEPHAGGGNSYLGHLRAVAESDISGLRKAEKSYGDSWKRRGGVDTFHMLTRKWDRVEKRAATAAEPGATPAASPYDIFEHIAADRRPDGLIDDVRDLRRYLMLVEAETLARKEGQLADSGRGFLDYLDRVAESDIRTLEEKEKSYGSSWKRRGGIAAFMMFARKWDRIEGRVTTSVAPSDGARAASRDNVFEHIAADQRSEGVLDDIRDLRQYLMLVEAEMAARNIIQIGTARDNQ